MDLAFDQLSIDGQISFPSVGEVVEQSCLLKEVPLDIAGLWVAECDHHAMDKRRYSQLLEFLIDKAALLHHKSPSAIRIDMESKLRLAFGGELVLYRPDCLQIIQDFWLNITSNHTPLQVCRLLDLPSACANHFNELTDIWSLSLSFAAYSFPSSPPVVGQELTFELIRLKQQALKLDATKE